MKFKKLAIISDCVHMFGVSGNVLTENHIYRKQMEMLSAHFEQTLICCPFTEYSSDKITSSYTNNSIQFYPLKNVGGDNIKAKFDLIKTIPSWFRAFKKANDFADIIYQRFPNNLNIPGFFYFYFKRSKTFATYTGTWKNYHREPPTYRFQKWLLKNYFRGIVGVYSNYEFEEHNFFKTFSPSYTLNDWNEESENVNKRIINLKIQTDFLPKFVTVGSLVPHKNQQYILDAFKILNQQDFDFRLYIVGDGFLRESYERFIHENRLTDKIFLTGKMTDVDLRNIYRKVNFLIQTPLSEGFGKVPIEGFFHGVIPFLNNTEMASEMIGDNSERGYLFKLDEPENLAEFILKAISEKKDWVLKISNGREYACIQTLEHWANIFSQKIENYFG
jgi:glycosyltransferase involved in cell wall biosynthesis